MHVESISAELTINQPRDFALYVRAFEEVARQAAFGRDASVLIANSLDELRMTRGADVADGSESAEHAT